MTTAPGGQSRWDSRTQQEDPSPSGGQALREYQTPPTDQLPGEGRPLHEGQALGEGQLLRVERSLTASTVSTALRWGLHALIVGLGVLVVVRELSGDAVRPGAAIGLVIAFEAVYAVG